MNKKNAHQLVSVGLITNCQNNGGALKPAVPVCLTTYYSICTRASLFQLKLLGVK